MNDTNICLLEMAESDGNGNESTKECSRMGAAYVATYSESIWPVKRLRVCMKEGKQLLAMLWNGRYGYEEKDRCVLHRPSS